MRSQTGTIKGFKGSWDSGIASLTVEQKDGTKTIYCDNAPTVRALDALFGNVIDGHSVNLEAILGRKIRYALDESSILAWIRGVEE
jgi:hypothetical protein